MVKRESSASWWPLPHLPMPRPLPVPFIKMMQEFKNLSSDLYWDHHDFSWYVISINFTFQVTTTKNSQKGRIFSIESDKRSLKYSHLFAHSLYCRSLRSQDIRAKRCWDLDLSTWSTHSCVSGSYSSTGHASFLQILNASTVTIR